MNSDVNRAGGQVERDIEQAITALKKGAYLLKYGRRGKPKFCPFRLSNDESALIWFSGKEEKHLKLSHVSRIISGQRTPIFQRYPRPEKEYQSFSLIYNDRSLDLICKDKDEAEVWFSGLKALISRGHQRKWRTESRSDGISSGATSPRTYTRRSSPLHSPFSSADSLQKVL
ncbi:PH, RCC1 and FYVE domains-containing protein 1-like [Lycium ferocissimum]|uniref:PH, RCC1 and FYVE domains-containing protein 1-like n=1 Tax=Lycium ferocissimum TaxID=112874 RepID=UPI0028164C12|nr:PH, RCC1 and FYVE domains-containing protein 1-like [Lycium ferocissimum]XP_059315317.1 PH, RCC1 and FYVE domains-containing protein 1-like [Lycium ferocissimum]